MNTLLCFSILHYNSLTFVSNNKIIMEKITELIDECLSFSFSFFICSHNTFLTKLMLLTFVAGFDFGFGLVDFLARTVFFVHVDRLQCTN